VSPATATLAANHRVTVTAQVNGTANSGVTWNVNGVAGGNVTIGQICVVGSSPCQTVTSEAVLQVDYVAPGAIPTPNPVTVQATSTADTTKSASSQITVINRVLVSVLPASVTLAPLAVQGFTASVLGTANQSVVWQIQGTACTSAGICGSIDANGAYTAPGAAPTPDALQVVAVSADDTSQSGTANVTISTGASILTLHPASVYAGAADGFTLLVNGISLRPIIRLLGLDRLPAAAQNYLRFLESESGAKIGMVSTGPDRDQTIFLPEFSTALKDLHTVVAP